MKINITNSHLVRIRALDSWATTPTTGITYTLPTVEATFKQKGRYKSHQLNLTPYYNKRFNI